MKPTLETARLVLRPHVPARDAAPVFAMRTHPEGTRFLSRLPPATVAEVEERLVRVDAACDRGEMIGVTVTRRDDGAFLGLAGLVRLDLKHGCAEIAYELDHAHWGQGYMREAIARLVRHGFDELGLHRLEIRTHPDNARSMRLAVALGFTKEGVLRENERHARGHWEDTVVFGRLARD